MSLTLYHYIGEGKGGTRMKGRIIAVLLILTMIFTLVPVNEVRAGETNEQVDSNIAPLETKEEMTEEELQELADVQLMSVYDEVYRLASEFQQTEQYSNLMEAALLQSETGNDENQEQNQGLKTDETFIEDSSIKDPNFDKDNYTAWKEEIASDLQNNESDLIRPAMLAATALNGNIMSNEYLGACIIGSGNITLGTTGGDPASSTDNNKKLLYGYPGSSTTYSTVRIDGADIKFYPNGGVLFYPDGSKCIATMVEGDVTIQQIVTFDMNYSTGRKDMARIQYIIANSGTVNHSVGVRIMLDTMLGDNDGVPFRIPGKGNVTQELELSGNDIPQYWQAFDSFERPTVIANGCFYKSVSSKPDKVQFTHWGSIYDKLWNYTVNSNQYVTGDSAVAMYYNPKTILPGGQRIVETFYGIGDSYSGNEESELSLRVVAPRALIANSQTGSYESNPFTVTVYIKNNSTVTAKNVKANISLPATGELVLVGTSGATKSVGDIAAGVEKAVTFSVKAQAQKAAKVVEGSVILSATNCSSQSTEFQMTLPKVTVSKAGSIALNKISLQLEVYKSETLIATVSNLSGPVTWVSDNPAVATVGNNGRVTAKKVGTANIKASIGGKVASCKVTVTGAEIPVAVMYFSPSTITMDVKDTKNLRSNLVFIPSNATAISIKSWKSSNPSVVSVANGTITALKEGTATISATLASKNMTASITVTVQQSEPQVTLASNIDFSITEAGPTISFGGHQWNLFDLPLGIKLTFGNKVKLVYDDDKDKYVASFGDVNEPTKSNETDSSGRLTAEAKQLRKSTYRTVKSLVNSVGQKTNQEFYNTYRSLIKKGGPMVITGDKSIFGYVEFNRTSTGGYSFGAGEVCVLFTAGVDLKYKFPPAPVVFLRFSITGTLQAGLKVKMLEAGNLSKGVDVSGEISLALKPLLGVGGDIGIAKVEGGLEGEIKGTVNLRPLSSPAFSASRDLKVTLKASLYLSYKALFFINGKKTWPISDFTVYPKNGNRSMQSPIAAIQNDELELISTEFAEDPSYFTGNNLRAVNAMDSNTSSQNIKSNVYPYGEPQIAELGQGKYLLVWLDHNNERANDENATSLYYSFYNGAAWSEPEVVEEDGTADFAPCVTVKDNVAYIAWQNSEVVYEEGVSLEEVASTIGIKVAEFKDGKLTISQITEPDQKLESAPILAADNNSVAVVWTRNSQNDIFGVEGENTIYQSSLLVDGWSEPEEIHTETGYMGTISAVINDGKLYIAYAKDRNGQLEDFSDDEIMLIVGDNEPVQITTNELMDANAKLIVNEDDVSLYWYEDGSIIYRPIADQEDQRILDISEYAGMNFDILSNGIDQVILWEDTDGFSTNLKAVYYNTETSEWGDVIALTSQQNRIRETNAILTKDGSLCAVFILADLLENYEGESSPYGECNLVLLQQTPGYDLGIEGSILYDETSVAEGALIDLGVLVANKGQKAVEGFELQLKRNGEVIQSQVVSEQILAGEELYYEIPYQLSTPFEAHDLEVYVLPLNHADIKLADNSANVSLGKAFIELSGLSITGTKNARTVSVQVNNSGYVNSDALYIEMIESDGENETVKAATVIDSINKQDSTHVEFDYAILENLFTRESSLDQLIYIRVYDYNTMSVLDYNFTNLPNPYFGDHLTVSDVALVGNTMILNVDNNLPEEVSGLLCIRHETEDDQVVIYGQEIVQGSFYGQSYEVDLTGIDMEGGTLSVYVVDEEGWGISNEVVVDGTNTARLLKPFATPAGGEYETEQYVTLESTNENTAIYYTVDGTDPVVEALGTFLYTEPILVDKSTTIKAIAAGEDMLDSEIAVFEYMIGKEICETPTASPVSGTYDAPQSVILLAGENARIYYTTDGSNPKEVSGASLYAEPIIVEHSMTIKAYAICEDMEDSEVAVFDYIITEKEEPNYTANFRVTNQWNTGFQGEIVLTNISDEVIRNWNLGFETDFKINNMWNASIKEHIGQNYVIGYTDWNQFINPGTSVVIGFTGEYTGQVNDPVNYSLYNANTTPDNINCEVTYTLASAWNEAYQGYITIKNNSSQKLVDWTLEFDFDGTITQFYTADIVEHTGNHYVIKGKSYNCNIYNGSRLDLQFVVSTPQIPLELKNIKIY